MDKPTRLKYYPITDEWELEHSPSVWVGNVHDPSVCVDQPCTIHNMSQHSMRGFPQHWRSDKGIMERICPHGIGHPDPDDHMCTKYDYLRVHGCDGCCLPPKEV